MTIILGIDPGSRNTGFGVVRAHANRSEYIASGVIRVADYEFSERLRVIFESLQAIIHQHAVESIAIEQVFVGKSANSALKLGQARGAAITAAAVLGFSVHEYSARQIKQAAVGTGSADKQQIQHMVKTLLKLSKAPAEDAADALACAICHQHTQHNLLKMAGNRSGKRPSHYRQGRVR
ncbi:MAG: crossover junction endodeoxyribonuclease RuvC [Pseudomonadales bacterium]|nr:crossover junction endodeoxyribonuclease RuvC [Pseudomonadales bacterium]